MLPLGGGRPRYIELGEEGMACLCKKNKPLPLWQVVRRAEFRLVFRPLTLSDEHHTTKHLTQGSVKTRSCPQSTKRAPHDCETWGWCVRELERDQAGRKEERKQGGREERA